MEYTILPEQMALLEYVVNERLTERLLNAASQSNMCHVSELDNQSRKNTYQSNRIKEWKGKQLHGQLPAKTT